MQRDTTTLTDEHFDLLVCGGGVYGAWCACDAALRGLKVALIDQGDWAGATSSASTKLIHGGLRYLEQWDLGLVRLSLQERQALFRIAPHRVWPLTFVIPVYRGSRPGLWQARAGLWLYDRLAGIHAGSARHRHISRQQLLSDYPGLSESELRGGFSYLDGQTDDARLVLELVAGALRAGACCVNYCRLTEELWQQGEVAGAVLEDSISGATIPLRTRRIIYTTGAWLSRESLIAASSRLTKGVHLLLPKLPFEQALLLTAPQDGRVMFIIPWYGRSLVGTTDLDYRGALDALTVSTAETNYLLTAVNRLLPGVHWQASDVLGQYAGIRLLRRRGKDRPSDVSREWVMQDSGDGRFYSIGGKLTSARHDAAELVDAVVASLNHSANLAHAGRCETAQRLLPWAPSGDFAHWLAQVQQRALSWGIDADCALCLARRYGICVEQVFKLIQQTPALAQRIHPQLPFLRAELVYCASSEMVQHLDDLLRRRLPLALLLPMESTLLASAGELAGAALGWSPQRIATEIRCCEMLFGQSLIEPA
ncbi:MAG: glycerol-3-phosphate dehydrogenase/oxidase [Gammaproteobacteria bacterium]|jgi:glycerol-3-phosphate dehydrogenase|nr:glycerol-3-phosphate dehydrogenase/oxidase [Gammaproteobacteria bacterium]